MNQSPIRLGTLITLALLVVAPLAASAQAVLSRERVQAEIDRTDLRIDNASMLVAGAGNAMADLELVSAKGLQSQAKSVFGGGDAQLRVAYGLTIQARGHADRAIALVKGLPDPDRVLAQVERTRDILERASDRLQDCNNDRARALLRVGTEMQHRAEAAAGESRYLAALQFTLSARERIFRSLRLCNRDDNLGDSAQRAVTRTDDVLSRAADVLSDHATEAARAALDRAQGQQRQALDQLRAHQFEAALRLTFNARSIAQRAIRLAYAKP